MQAENEHMYSVSENNELKVDGNIYNQIDDAYVAFRLIPIGSENSTPDEGIVITAGKYTGRFAVPVDDENVITFEKSESTYSQGNEDIEEEESQQQKNRSLFGNLFNRSNLFNRNAKTKGGRKTKHLIDKKRVIKQKKNMTKKSRRNKN
jgi:hypothetical protein